MRPEEKPEIAALPLFAAMHPDQRDRIFAASFLQVFPPQLTLFKQGERADFLHILVSGLVELFAANGERETTMALVRPVRSFILAAAYTDRPYLMSARTLATSRIMLTPASILHEVIEADLPLMRSAMSELAGGFRMLVHSLADLKLRQSAERLANFILLEKARRSEASAFDLPIEKKVLASLLGMTAENLSRSFAMLQQHGVKVSGAHVDIHDAEALQCFARPDPFLDRPDP